MLPEIVLKDGLIHDLLRHRYPASLDTVLGGGGSAPIVKDGHLYVNSGYGIYFHMPGNVLLVFSVDGA